MDDKVLDTLVFYENTLSFEKMAGIFLVNDFWTPPPFINFVHGAYM